MGFCARPSRGPKVQQFTEDSWLVEKSNRAEVVLRAGRRPPAWSTSRTRCTRMEQSPPPLDSHSGRCSSAFSAPKLRRHSPAQPPSRHLSFYFRRLIFGPRLHHCLRAAGSHDGLSSNLAQHQRLVSACWIDGRVACGHRAGDPTCGRRGRLSGRIRQLSSGRPGPSVSPYQSAYSRHLRKRQPLPPPEIDG